MEPFTALTVIEQLEAVGVPPPMIRGRSSAWIPYTCCGKTSTGSLM
jgi:hypothetical protein